MDKIKRVINCVVPVKVCNFKCHYCYVGQNNVFNGKIEKLKYDNAHIQKALTKERLGGTCLINLCAEGETLLAPYLIDLIKRLLDNGHYVAIVTNGLITNKIEELCKFTIKQKSKLFIKFSYHFLELKKLNLTKNFFDNIKKIQNSNISFTVELTVNDESIPFIDDIKKDSLENLNFLPHVIESRNTTVDNFPRLTKLDEKEHLKIWQSFDSNLINFQTKEWMKKRCEFCYGGDWVLNLYLLNGDISICNGGGPKIGNIFEDINEPIHTYAIGNNCPFGHCFAAYFLLTFGVIPELNTPTYENMRERENWLQKEMKEFYSSKLIESNKEYSDDKKLLINTLRSIEENNDFDISECANLSKKIEENLLQQNIKTIAIYNDDKFSKWLYELLRDTQIKVKFLYVLDSNYGIDSNINKFKHHYRYLYKKIKQDNNIILDRNDTWPHVDGIIITEYVDYSKHKELIKNKTNDKAILITEIISK